MGSAPRDDDLAADYGGVGYLYNELEVKVYVPVATNSGNGPGWAITTGLAIMRYVTVKQMCLFDPTISASPYADVPHGLGVYPDFVTVQLTLSDGYVSEAQGTTTTTSDHSTKWVNSCGTIFGVTDSSVTLWAAAGADDFVACFKDGWGTEDVSFSSASVDIRAWVLTPSETKDNSVAHGRAFYGAGSASQGELNEAFGGTVYGYSQSQVVLWTSDVSHGKPIYVDGIWGGGTDPLQVSDVLITIRVIATGALIIPVVACPPPPSIADGYYDLSNDTVQYFCNEDTTCGTPPILPNTLRLSNGFNNASVTLYSCNSGFSSNAQLCTSPPEVPNTVKKISGFSNGSLTVYACVSGFVANGEVPYISCNGTHWTNTLFACSVSSDCGSPPSLPDTSSILKNQTTAVYSCLPGYTSNNSNSVIYLANSCPPPPDITNAVKVPGGYSNGSLTVYTCVSGFVPNGEDPYITCNGTHWTTTLFACSGFQTGNLALYSCVEGYVATGGLSTIACNGTHWSQTNFSCLEGSLQPSLCGPPLALSNAYYEITNNTATYHCHRGYTANQTDNVISCVQGQWEEPKLSCLDISCPTPPDIANALKISDGLHNGSITMYACLPDYVASNAANTIVCNETSWTLTNLSCSLVSAPAGCELPPSIPNGYYKVQGDTASYHCLGGYTATTITNTIQCVGAAWEQLSLQCIGKHTKLFKVPHYT
uniref:Sushi, von Willebrand factor type A, EGF and pentraxin domain-containing protein 1 n=1 Tax=Magallana gigas TaxID=29159 RepID=K1P4U8_MAGGI